MKPLPNLRHLRYLVALHDQLSFSRAAEACFVTQSTLSAGIRELENALGIAVAERSRHSVVITPAGRSLVGRARLLLQDAESLMAMALEEGKPMSGTIELGVLPTIGPFLLPRLIRDLRQRFPHLRLRLREDKTRDLLDRLTEGRLDLVLMAFPYETGNLDTYPLFEDAYRYVCATSLAPLQGTYAVPIPDRDIQSQDMLLLEPDHCLHRHALPILQRAAQSDHACFASTSLHTLVAMVSEGMGATLLPDLAINGGILQSADVLVRPLRQDANARTIGLCWRKGSPRAEMFQSLGQFMREWAVQHIRPWAPVERDNMPRERLT
ncbi:TPA: LysR substrate-binding domain-containing protein [Pseudomonas aeruginosa]